MQVKITTLIENSLGEHKALKNEHGLSFLIEQDDRKILFDTGQSGAFIDNAEQLRIDVAKVDTVVLSHGHYDHSGGLKSLCRNNQDFELWVGDGFFDDKYGVEGPRYEFLGNNFGPEYLAARNIQYRTTAGQDIVEIGRGIFIVGSFPRVYQDEQLNSRFLVNKGDSFEVDQFVDEVLLVIETEKGLVVLLGCSHPGLKNMLDTVRDRFHKQIWAVMGGTHLVEAGERSLNSTMEYLQNFPAALLGVSHCTGKLASAKIAAVRNGFFHNRTGTVLMA